MVLFQLIVYIIAGVLMILFSGRVCTFSYTSEELITLGQVIDTLSLCSNAAKTEELKFRNELLEYENYRKGFFPTISLDEMWRPFAIAYLRLYKSMRRTL